MSMYSQPNSQNLLVMLFLNELINSMSSGSKSKMHQIILKLNYNKL